MGFPETSNIRTNFIRRLSFSSRVLTAQGQTSDGNLTEVDGTTSRLLLKNTHLHVTSINEVTADLEVDGSRFAGVNLFIPLKKI